ncbi:putative toxin-antitoxin system, toxin component [Desulfitobacterium hafniense DP7]|uniref:Putative toxin-antitoxin system, toxin component n=1 Tax=Desulfitobacterium hafniense DP7 TaxID=537010 RepID=G9XHL2_DESHA|nr:ImmA/IrrE family metallo-endopeptidase [Desulfitobacterium hafniense]EHL08795.1 putative toxin-antitoxin system, toxin component [Desulfitobacterium hafniense DP7]
MNKYEALLSESPVVVNDCAELPPNYSGLYVETSTAKAILIDKAVKARNKKTCVLAEELGHCYTTSGNIMDQADIRNRKQEQRARNWAYEKLIPLQSLVEASREGIRNRYELAEYLDVTEEFLGEALSHYRAKYGLYTTWTSFVIYFEPLGVIELYE